MDVVDRLKSSYSLLGDPLHRDAWEEIERLREQNFYLDIRWTETSNALIKIADEWGNEYGMAGLNQIVREALEAK